MGIRDYFANDALTLSGGVARNKVKAFSPTPDANVEIHIDYQSAGGVRFAQARYPHRVIRYWR